MRQITGGFSVDTNEFGNRANKERGDVPLLAQVLFYPVTDASFDTASYHQFAERGRHVAADRVPGYGQPGAVEAVPRRRWR